MAKLKYRYWLVLLFLSILLCVNLSASKRVPHKPALFLLPGQVVPRFDFFEECKNVSSPTRILNSKMATVGKTITVDADFVFERWINHVIKTTVLFRNCIDRNPGTCELFQTWRFGDESCRMLEMKNQIWSTLFQNVHPPLKCPLGPGEYFLRNGSFDMSLLLMLPFPHEQYFWRVRIESFDPKTCFCVELGCHYLRTFN